MSSVTTAKEGTMVSFFQYHNEWTFPGIKVTDEWHIELGSVEKVDGKFVGVLVFELPTS